MHLCHYRWNDGGLMKRYAKANLIIMLLDGNIPDLPTQFLYSLVDTSWYHGKVWNIIEWILIDKIQRSILIDIFIFHIIYIWVETNHILGMGIYEVNIYFGIFIYNVGVKNRNFFMQLALCGLFRNSLSFYFFI